MVPRFQDSQITAGKFDKFLYITWLPIRGKAERLQNRLDVHVVTSRWHYKYNDPSRGKGLMRLTKVRRFLILSVIQHFTFSNTVKSGPTFPGATQPSMND